MVIPDKWKKKLLVELHKDDPGICRMKHIARSYMWWPGLDALIESLARSCVDCQAAKNAPPAAPYNLEHSRRGCLNECTLTLRGRSRVLCFWWW